MGSGETFIAQDLGGALGWCGFGKFMRIRWMGQGSLQSLLLSTPQARGCFSLFIKPLMLIVLFTLQPSEDCVKNVSRTRPPEHPTPSYSQFLWNQQMGICCGASAGLESLRPEACKHWMPGCNQRPPPRPHSNLHILDSV